MAPQNTAIAFLAVPSDGRLTAASGASCPGYSARCELNVRPDHVRMVAWILPKLSVSEVMGPVKGKTAIHVFRQFSWLKRSPYWGNHFWAEGHCVDMVCSTRRKSGFM